MQGRSRSGSDNDRTPLTTRTQPPQMTYFFTDEDSLGISQAQSSQVQHKAKESPRGSTYGVESLETTTSSLTQDSVDDQEGNVQAARRNWKNSLRQSRPSDDDVASMCPSQSSNGESRYASPYHQRRTSEATISRPFTPLSFGSPAPPSIISSPVSRRNSDTGSMTNDNNSQAIISSGEEEKEMGLELTCSWSAPQLVMPSIKMPSRRPFTEKGKNMGRLKVLIAGDSGISSAMAF